MSSSELTEWQALAYIDEQSPLRLPKAKFVRLGKREEQTWQEMHDIIMSFTKVLEAGNPNKR